MLSSIFLAATATLAGPQFLSAQTPPSPTAIQLAQQDLLQQQSILKNPNATPPLRYQAAQRLVQRSTPESDELLLAILKDLSNRDGQLAVAKALAFDPTPTPQFIEPLVNLLADKDLGGPAAQALAIYKTNIAVRDRLISFANNTIQSLGTRTAVIRAIGKLVDKSAAKALIDLVNRPNENSLIREAAMEALGEMTGLSRYGRDAQQWNQWWKDNGNRSDLDWFRELLNKNVERVNDLNTRLNQAREQTSKLMHDEFDRAPAASRFDVLKPYLQADFPDTRWAAVQIIYEQVGQAKIPPAIFQVLRGMVKDVSVDVRIRVIRTLAAANDPGAVEALLAQLSQEADTEARKEIVRALGPIQDLKVTVKPLLARLNDDLYSVAREAADALRQKADLLRTEENQPIANEVAGQLLARLRTINSEDPAAAPLRQSLVEAMARLAHPSFRAVFDGMLRDSSPAVRRAALHGLGKIGNPDSANMVVAALRDIDPGVRLEAVTALRTTASFAHAEALYRLLSSEPDATVRAEIWKVLAGADLDDPLALFQKASIAELLRWAERYKLSNVPADLERRVAILRFAEKRLVSGQTLDAPANLAFVRENLGQTLLQLDKPAEAAVSLQLTLDHWIKQNAAASVTYQLTQQLMEALLRNQRYSEAATFAKGEIEANRIDSSTMWFKIKQEIERLRDKRDYTHALALIEEAKKIQLDALSSSQMANIEGQIKLKLNTGGRVWVQEILPRDMWDGRDVGVA